MPISETVLQRFWASAGLDQYEAQDWIDRLVEWSLAQRDEQDNLSLHDLQVAYMRKIHQDCTIACCRLMRSIELAPLKIPEYIHSTIR